MSKSSTAITGPTGSEYTGSSIFGDAETGSTGSTGATGPVAEEVYTDVLCGQCGGGKEFPAGVTCPVCDGAGFIRQYGRAS